VPDPLAAMTAAADLLVPGGIVALITPNIDGLFPKLSYRVAGRVDFWPHVEPPAHLIQFSKDTLTTLLARSHLEPVELRDGHISLTYSVGSPSLLRRSPKRAAYAALFAPAIYLGPLFKAGDKTIAVARRSSS
jgi:hypothetical protein